MTDIEIPHEAVKAVAEVLAQEYAGAMWDMYTATPRQLLVGGHMPTAQLAVAAALPALRRQWAETLAPVAKRARVEANAGAPAGMVAVYVAEEVRHVTAGHTGQAQQCDECAEAPVCEYGETK